MHKRRLNELVLQGLVEPDGPILIKSGTESGADPTLPSMNFVRTRHPVSGQRTIYLPGSSLKGTLRSHVERIIRTVKGDAPDVCCDPLGDKSCGERIKRENAKRDTQDRKPLTTAEEYCELCLACRIFGHTAHASHFTSADAYPAEAIDTLPVRQGVAINRFSGGVGVGPFEIEVATTGKFQLRLMLTNFELWQVGLLALALRDLGEGRLLIGFGKSRGLGKVKLRLTHLEIGYPGRFGDFDAATRLHGMGALAGDLTSEYTLVPGDALPLPAGGQLAPDGQLWGRPAVRFGLTAPNAAATSEPAALDTAHSAVLAALAACVPAWAAYTTPGVTHG
jgi:CRISPR-associated protein Csm3